LQPIAKKKYSEIPLVLLVYIE